MKQAPNLIRLLAVCSLSVVISNQVFAQKELGNAEENVVIMIQPYQCWLRQIIQDQTEAFSPKAEYLSGMILLNTNAKAIQVPQEKFEIPYSSIISMLYESSRPKYASEFKARKNNRFLTIRFKKKDASEWVVVLFLGKTHCQNVIADLEARTGKKTEGMR